LRTNPNSNKKCQDVQEDDIDENYALLGYRAASSGIFLPTFRDKLSVQSSWARMSSRAKNLFIFGLMTTEDEIDRLFRNVGKKLPRLAT
jgi:hypothetical protein